MADDSGGIGGILGGAIGMFSGGSLGSLVTAGALVGGFLTRSIGTAEGVAATKTFADTSSQIATQQTQIAGQKNVLTQSNIQQELNIEQQRKNAMELNAYRQSLENVRNVNRTLGAARAAAANSGALFGSGAQGARGQIEAQGAFNQVGIQQGLQIGENVFAANQQISQNRIGLAGLQYQHDVLGYQEQLAKNQYAVSQSTAQGLSSFGGSLMSAAGPLGNLLSGFKKS